MDKQIGAFTYNTIFRHKNEPLITWMMLKNTFSDKTDTKGHMRMILFI